MTSQQAGKPRSGARSASRALVAAMLLAPLLTQGAPLDRQARDMLDPLREQALRPEELVRRLRLAPDAVVADVGAGPGFFSLPLARAVPRGRVLATDVRPEFLALVRERAAAAKLGNIETRLVEPTQPGLSPASVDAVFVCQVDHYLADRGAYFAELARALKPGGRLIVVNFDRYREPVLVAARSAGLRPVEEWRPTPPFFVLVLAR
jgi:ubiquinone/menaquinone biosynthesis C-methylase UbiE